MSPEVSERIRKEVEEILSRFPEKNAALLPVLHAAQREFGYISVDTEKMVAVLLGIPAVKVREVVTFYTMYNRKPVGRHHIQICSNLTCSLLGGESLLEILKAKLKVEPGGTTEDMKFTLSTVECLGACEEAPCMMVNFDYYGHLDKNRIDEILDQLK